MCWNREYRLKTFAKREQSPIRRNQKQETPARDLCRFLVGVSFLFGLYGGRVLAVEAASTWSLRNIDDAAIRHVPDTGGRLVVVSARLYDQADGL